jgi:hypothetical protein
MALRDHTIASRINMSACSHHGAAWLNHGVADHNMSAWSHHGAAWSQHECVITPWVRFQHTEPQVCFSFINSRLKRYLQESNFSGISGQVIFKEGERYLPTVNILQHFAGGSPVTVGQFVPVNPGETKCTLYEGCLTLYEALIKWPGGTRPTDGRPGIHDVYLYRTFARWRHLTTTTRMLSIPISFVS